MSLIVQHGFQRIGRAVMEEGARKGVQGQQRRRRESVSAQRRQRGGANLVLPRGVEGSYLLELVDQLRAADLVGRRRSREANLGAGPLRAAVALLAIVL